MSIKATNGKACATVSEFSTIRTEACTRVSGDLTKCKARENCSTSLANLPTRAIGLMTNLKEEENYTTNTQK